MRVWLHQPAKGIHATKNLKTSCPGLRAPSGQHHILHTSAPPHVTDKSIEFVFNIKYLLWGLPWWCSG